MTTDTLNSAVPPQPATTPGTPSSSSSSNIKIRPRLDSDLDEAVQLCELQQPGSEYPWCWPPPMPPADFVKRGSELFSLVAFSGSKMVGHVAVQRIARDDEGITWLEGLDIPVGEEDRIRSVSVLFQDPGLMGSGLGGRLLDSAVQLIRMTGAIPVLDVLGKRKAHGVYVARGFQSLGYGDPDWLKGCHIKERVEFFHLPEDTGRTTLDITAGRVGGKEKTIFGDIYVPVQAGLEGELPRPTMSEGETDLVACRVLAEEGPERERRGKKAWLASSGDGSLQLYVEKGAVQEGQRIALGVPSRAVAVKQ
ncbi:hypothetical protein A1Q2_00537 [Trichosporon asahii var. asahii CBS 8904]|uniref:N-acetyltransferase domain-containing protein n=2 Tax=Trichosporon asahii var. asahii TaxID=189963 RepID=K1VXE0_TRIAC|nr:hypothetical protein A1Q1_04003 [Trichosporon asahii var. asahii CBS 2479]EJT52487.1 hypothetical protein A1Q1_04003 [Trichosporon asahii var. asahii CBS 2479]EKD05171.1 hypothetical protein A1Q2_00537 [Trichosporon asahii var. asahii CBS 8904]